MGQAALLRRSSAIRHEHARPVGSTVLGQTPPMQRAVPVSNRRVIQAHQAVIQRGQTPSRMSSEPDFNTYRNVDYTFTTHSSGTTHTITVTAPGAGQVGYARYTLEAQDADGFEAPEDEAPYTAEHVQARMRAEAPLAHLTGIYNETLTRDGPADIYRGFAVELLSRIEQHAQDEGAEAIYLEPATSPVRQDPNTNTKVNTDPTGFYTARGYAIDDTALAHNRDVAEGVLPGNMEDRDNQKETMARNLTGGVLFKALG